MDYLSRFAPINFAMDLWWHELCHYHFTGGTGLTGRDGTPEAVQGFIWIKKLLGLVSCFRQNFLWHYPTSTVQSRAIAGWQMERFLFFVLPGSSGACKTAWIEILQHSAGCPHRPCKFLLNLFHAFAWRCINSTIVSQLRAVIYVS